MLWPTITNSVNDAIDEMKKCSTEWEAGLFVVAHVHTCAAILWEFAEQNPHSMDVLVVRKSPSDRPGVMTTYTGPRYTAVVPYEHYCNVRLLVDPSGRIITWTHSGNPSGCRSYNKALKAYAEQAHTQKNRTPTN